MRNNKKIKIKINGGTVVIKITISTLTINVLHVDYMK